LHLCFCLSFSFASLIKIKSFGVILFSIPLNLAGELFHLFVAFDVLSRGFDKDSEEIINRCFHNRCLVHAKQGTVIMVYLWLSGDYSIIVS
jgi:hypothetical protein